MFDSNLLINESRIISCAFKSDYSTQNSSKHFIHYLQRKDQLKLKRVNSFSTLQSTSPNSPTRKLDLNNCHYTFLDYSKISRELSNSRDSLSSSPPDDHHHRSRGSTPLTPGTRMAMQRHLDKKQQQQEQQQEQQHHRRGGSLGREPAPGHAIIIHSVSRPSCCCC